VGPAIDRCRRHFTAIGSPLIARESIQVDPKS
jgi:hypothetical protein